MTFSTRIVDMTSSRPAAGVGVRLDRQDGGRWRNVVHGVSDADGLVQPGGDGPPAGRGVYRFVFDTDAYFAELGQMSSYPEIVAEFTISDPVHAWALAVLIAPHAYTVCHTSRLSFASHDPT
jgi:5-hydroxyisourate hydrolase